MIFTVLWILWIVAFVVIEGEALLIRQPNSTLSAHVWRWFAVKDPRPTPRTWALRAVLLVFLVWLLLHLGFGWLSL